MSVITIRGQFGSGAPEIGHLVAQKIGGDYVDREIIAHVAERMGQEPQHVEAKEAPRAGMRGRIAQALRRAMGRYGAVSGVYAPAWQVPLSDIHYVESLTAVITELAEAPAVVIRGRGSQFILRNHPAAFHVLIVAPLEVRLARVTEALKLDREAAGREIERSESSHRAFIRRYFGADLEDPVYYHLSLNTEHLSYDAVAQLIAQASASGR